MGRFHRPPGRISLNNGEEDVCWMMMIMDEICLSRKAESRKCLIMMGRFIIWKCFGVVRNE